MATAAYAWKIKGGFDAAPEACPKSDWQLHDEQLHEFIKASIPEALVHTGASAFDAHLRGVQAVLRSWGSDEAVCDAGLFHSVYGTEGFQVQFYSLNAPVHFIIFFFVVQGF